MAAKAKLSLGIFWDIENCPIPTNKSPSAVAQRIRDFVGSKHLECSYANEFFCACDTRKLDSKSRISDGLRSNGVVVAHVSSVCKNAADHQLQELIDKFIRKYGSNSVLVLITGDINFDCSIRKALSEDIKVVLIHDSNCSQSLKDLANESYLFDDLFKNVKIAPKNVNQLKPEVSNLPKDQTNEAIISRLSQLADNCGGKPENVLNGKALIRFGCREDAQRSLQRMSGEDCFGLKIKLKLIEEEMKDVKTQSNQTQASTNKCLSVIKGLETGLAQDLTELVKNLVNSWNDSEINGNSIVSVERNTKQTQSDGKWNLFVTAISADTSRALVTAARRHLTNSSGIIWTRYRSTSNSISEDNRNHATASPPNGISEDCLSVIRGMFSKEEQNVKQLVEKLVTDWKDNKIKPNFISSVSRSTKYVSGDGKVALFVTAISAQASKHLIAGADKYLDRKDGITWTEWRRGRELTRKEQNESNDSDINGIKDNNSCNII